MASIKIELHGKFEDQQERGLRDFVYFNRNGKQVDKTRQAENER